MSLKIFLPMGEKPPEEFGRGHNTSRYQQASAISLPLLKRVREEDLELLLFPPSSTTSLLIVIFVSNLSSAPPPPFDSTLPSNTTTNNGSSNTPSTPAAAVTSTGSIADGSRLTTSSYPLLDGLLKANTRHPTNKTSRLEDLFLHRSNSNNIGTTTALPFPRSSSGTRIFTSDTVRSLPSSSRDNNTNVTHTTSNAVFDLQSLFLQPPTTSNTTKSKDVVSAGATSNNNNNNNNPTTTSSIANHSHHHIQTYDAAQLVQANSITINAFSCLNSPKQQGNTCSDTTTTATIIPYCYFHHKSIQLSVISIHRMVITSIYSMALASTYSMTTGKQELRNPKFKSSSKTCRVLITLALPMLYQPLVIIPTPSQFSTIPA